MIQTKVVAKGPEIMWDLNISKDGKSYQENYILLFPRYVSAIDEEWKSSPLRRAQKKTTQFSKSNIKYLPGVDSPGKPPLSI